MPRQERFLPDFYMMNWPALIIMLVWLPACKTSKPSVYFENLPKDTLLQNLVTKDFEIKIRKGDVVGIGVSSLSTEGSTLFTAPQTTLENAAAPGYLVDKTGSILFPKLGNIAVEGLTRDELKQKLLTDLLPYLKDPVVTVTFVNHKITVIGDVGAKEDEGVLIPLPERIMFL